jgi:Tfp pilus assembly protein PilF
MAPITWRAEQILEMAVSALQSGDFEKSAKLCEAAIKVKPDFAEAFHIRGACLLRLQRPFDAVMCFDRSIGLNEDQSDCWNNRGIAMAEIGLFDSARDSFQKSLSLHRSVEPHIMCGGMFAHLMKLPEAEAEFRAAIEIEPQLQDAHLKLGVILLGQRKFKEGWKEYQWRWYNTPFPPRAFRKFPKWEGQDLRGKRIVLYSEQGFGDEIMSLRFVDWLKKNADRIIVEVRPSIVRLAQRTFKDTVVVMCHGDPYPEDIDYSSPLLDVPMYYEFRPPFGARRQYLSAGRNDEWRERLKDLPPHPKVGICWVAGRRVLQPETEKSAKAKSVSIELLEPLMKIQNINWISLQIPRTEIPRGWPIIDLTEHIDDFLDTAQLINVLDFVVTVDTSVAHLAGALDRPCLTLVRFNGYWPWLEPKGGFGETTPWYPSMRLYRQPELGYWEPAIEAIKKAVEARI